MLQEFEYYPNLISLLISPWFCFAQGIHGVSKIKDGYNPATWMLEVTTIGQEQMLGVDFSDIYKKSELYQ